MIAVVVPTIRPESYQKFLEAWTPLFKKHDVILVKVVDGDIPTVNGVPVDEVMGDYSDLIFNKNDGVRNLGFAYVAYHYPAADTIITLDDDTKPLGDTIQDHLGALQMKVCTSWLSTASEFTRGVPYGIRNEAEVVLSHGVWEGVKDWDAPTQLVRGNPDVTFFKGPIPRGINYPMCGMNIAFKRKMLPYMYFAPMGHRAQLDRFADIWCGIESKKIIDKKGWAVVSGYSSVLHERASNTFTNLEKEARGLRMNEEYGKDCYFEFYRQHRERWAEFIQLYL